MLAKRLAKSFFIFSLLWLLNSCAATRIDEAHSMLAKTGESAEVYFLRPGNERPMGLGDNAIRVDIDGEHLLHLQTRQLLGVRLMAGNMDIAVHTLAQVGTQTAMKELMRKDRFSFEAGQRYYVLMKMIDGEFRGLSYAPVMLSEKEATALIESLQPVGRAAKDLKDSLSFE